VSVLVSVISVGGVAIAIAISIGVGLGVGLDVSVGIFTRPSTAASLTTLRSEC